MHLPLDQLCTRLTDALRLQREFAAQGFQRVQLDMTILDLWRQIATFTLWC